MKGVMLRGPADLVDEPGGHDELDEQLGDLPGEPAVVRIRPRSAVWWSGWASGTVRPS